MSLDLLHAALDYAGRGWVPLPIRPWSKVPLMAWRRLLQTPPSRGDIETWWRDRWPDANVALLTGATQHLAVIDLDGSAAIKRANIMGLPATAPRARTARGEHVYCLLESPMRTARLLPGIEVRADGAYVVAPPSMHPSGVPYTWLVSPGRDLPPLPEWCLRADQTLSADHRPGWVERALLGVEEGQRNVTCARLVGYFLSKAVPVGVVRAVLLSWNCLNHPPLADSEVSRTVAAVATQDHHRRVEELPTVEQSLIAFLANPLARTCTHGERSTYQALCVIGWLRGLPLGTQMFVSYREMTTYGGVSPQHSHAVLSRLAIRGLIEFEPAGRGAGLHGLACKIRLVPHLNKGETIQ